ncbi:MAG: AMP-binding protein [Bauldia litoralis]
MSEAYGSIPELFSRVVRSQSGKEAIRIGPESWTYATLDERAGRVTRQIAAVGHPRDRLAVLLPHDIGLFVTMLAALKAGHVVLVLNPNDPQPRLEQLIADAEPAVIATDEAGAPRANALAPEGTQVLRIDASSAAPPTGGPGVRLSDTDPAFLTYTSGSTGRPKAVVLRHDTVARSVSANLDIWGVAPADRIALPASLWGAQGNNTLWTTLLGGATVCVFPAVERGVTGLARWLVAERITVFPAASSLLRHFIRTLDDQDAFPDIRLVKLSADSATWDDIRACRRYFPNASVVYAMGCSEVGGTIAFQILSPADPIGDGPLPVGRPPPDLDVRIVDEEGEECPPGTTGTITVRSRALSGGYWKDPALTARHFIDLPDGARIFRSEDRAFVNAEGLIVLAGRRDSTYKIRGQRTDLAEVERGVASLPGILEAAAIVRHRPGGEAYLIACIVPRPGGMLEPRRARTAARAMMPRNLVPSHFVVLDSLPRTANGKVDRNALRAIEPPGAEEHVPPITGTERMLERLWARAFDLDAVGRTAGFLDLGGDSLIGAVIAADVDAETGVQLAISLFAENTSLGDMAAIIDRAADDGSQSDEPPLVARPKRERFPLSPLQAPFWRAAQSKGYGRRHEQSTFLEIRGRLDDGALQSALDGVVARHESLRTRFEVDGDGEPVQIVEPAQPLALKRIDCSRADDPDSAAATAVAEEAGASFDLTAAPPLRVLLVRLADDRHLLIMSAHHIVTDAFSWNIFASDLAEHYAAEVERRPASLDPLPIQFGDYAGWQRERHSAERVRAVVERCRRSIEAGPLPRIDSLRRFWRKRDEPSLSGDGSDPWCLPSETIDRLDSLGREHAATHFMTRVAAIAPVLSALTGCRTVAIRSIMTVRRRGILQQVFGPFANTVPLFIRCDPAATFREQIERTRAETMAAREMAEVPFDDLVAALAAEGVKMPSLFFWVHTTTPTPPLRAGPIEIVRRPSVHLPIHGVIVIRLNHTNEETGGSLDFDPRIYGASGMHDMLERTTRFVNAAAADPDEPVGRLIDRAGVVD